jgi:hypothetical protein
MPIAEITSLLGTALRGSRIAAGTQAMAPEILAGAEGAVSLRHRALEGRQACYEDNREPYEIEV